ncbi:MAG TPA: hypothetical protein PKC65_15915 [Pyrinomonadaceae bacterium]|nr:hypothetical protein [Pyrinomonadaceae bacterium]
MISEKHLQMYEILGFREKRLSAEEHNAAARHLLVCTECRDRLPLPSADEFWNSLMGDDLQRSETANRISPWVYIKERLSESLYSRIVTRKIIFAAFLLAATVGLSLFMLLQGGFSGDKSLVSEVSDGYSPVVLDEDIRESQVQNKFPNSVNSTASRTPDKSDSHVGIDKLAKSVNAPSQATSKKQNGSPILRTRPQTQAETRGKTPCGRILYMSFDARYTDKGLLLKWDKLAGAISYNIYLSDLDERLLDHFETNSKTSYLVTGTLDNETFYRLRLIATLENGERIVSESQNFRISDLKKGSQFRGAVTLRKRTAAAVRCLEVRQ